MFCLLLFLSSLSIVYSQQLVFPHGYFDSNNLKPFDAIYLNLLAQSNLEYGGVTLKELDDLDAQRKLVPRPKDLPRERLEDAKIFDRKPVQGPVIDKSHLQDHDTSPDNHHHSQESDSDEKSLKELHKDVLVETEVSKPVSKAHLQDHDTGIQPVKTPLEDDTVIIAQPSAVVPAPETLQRDGRPKNPFSLQMHDDPMGNPFEDIATRTPPRSRNQFQQVRRRYHRKRTHRKHHKHHHDEDIELDNMPTRTSTTTMKTPSPTLIPTMESTKKMRRLPNNPFRVVDISHPTVIRLPLPPPASEGFEEFQS